MRVGMVRMDLTRRLDAHRALSLTVSFLALVGWGAFADSWDRRRAPSVISAPNWPNPKAAQDQLQAERDQQQAAVGELTQVQAKLVSARDGLDTLAQKRERASAQVAAVQQEMTLLTKRLETKRAKISETGRARVAERTSKAKSKT